MKKICSVLILIVVLLCLVIGCHSVATIEGIYISTLPEKLNYSLGESLDLTGMVVMDERSNGTSRQVFAYTTSPINGALLDEAGKIPVTVEYAGKIADFLVNVSKSLVSSIFIKTYPTRTDYYVGDTVDTTGMILTVNYSDGTTADISSGFTVNPEVITTPGLQTVTVLYGGKTTEFTVMCFSPLK